MNAPFSPKFKKEVLDYRMDNPSESLNKIAKKFNVSSSTVNRWVREQALRNQKIKQKDIKIQDQINELIDSLNTAQKVIQHLNLLQKKNLK